MALATSNLALDDIGGVLGQSPPYYIDNCNTSTMVYAPGLNATYCAGATSAAKLSNLQTTPYNMGKFRGYNHTSLTTCFGTYGTCSSQSSVTVYTTYQSFINCYNNNALIFTNSNASTYASSGYYFDQDTYTYYEWEGTAWGDSGYCVSSVSVYRNTSSACPVSTAYTAYTRNGSNMSTCYSNSYDLYSDSAGTTKASSGWYSDSNSSSNTYYKWSGTAWTGTGTCAPALNYIESSRNSSNTCPINSGVYVWTLGTSISDSYSNSYPIYNSSAGTIFADAAWYSTTGDTNTYYIWSGTAWTGTDTCLTSFNCNAGFGTTTEACASETYSIYWHDGTGTYPVSGDHVYLTDASTLVSNNYYGYPNGKDQYRFYATSGVASASTIC